MGTKQEAEFKPFPWEKDVPLSCRTCTNSRYVTSVCYAAYQAREEADRVRGLISRGYGAREGGDRA